MTASDLDHAYGFLLTRGGVHICGVSRYLSERARRMHICALRKPVVFHTLADIVHASLI
jgi:hypothetical protein